MALLTASAVMLASERSVWRTHGALPAPMKTRRLPFGGWNRPATRLLRHVGGAVPTDRSPLHHDDLRIVGLLPDRLDRQADPEILVLGVQDIAPNGQARLLVKLITAAICGQRSSTAGTNLGRTVLHVAHKAPNCRRSSESRMIDG